MLGRDFLHLFKDSSKLFVKESGSKIARYLISECLKDHLKELDQKDFVESILGRRATFLSSPEIRAFRHSIDSLCITSRDMVHSGLVKRRYSARLSE